MIAVPLIIVGAILGAAMGGFIYIPGLSPAKKALRQQAKKQPAPVTAPAPNLDSPGASPPKMPQEPAKPGPDQALGDKKLAKLWAEMDTAALLPIINDWKDPELAAVLSRMDKGKVAEILGVIKPVRASRLSRELRRIASQDQKPS